MHQPSPKRRGDHPAARYSVIQYVPSPLLDPAEAGAETPYSGMNNPMNPRVVNIFPRACIPRRARGMAVGMRLDRLSLSFCLWPLRTAGALSVSLTDTVTVSRLRKLYPHG